MLQQVTLVTKPKMATKKLTGKMISRMEMAGFELFNNLPARIFTKHEIEDMYNLMGSPFTREEKNSWGFEKTSRLDSSGKSFVFTFEAEDGHNIMDTLNINGHYPVIYIKVT